MPYIRRSEQKTLAPAIEAVYDGVVGAGNGCLQDQYGALEYVFFRLLQKMASQAPRFHNMNALVGVLETTKGEFIRRVLGPYEDAKLIENWADGSSDE